MESDYPGYNDTEQYISGEPSCFFEFAEYNKSNHERMRRTYKAFNSDSIDDVIRREIREIGEEIHACGGDDALRGCFYMMVIAYRIMIKGKNDNRLARLYQSQIHLLEKYLDGIGGWDA